jgi:hypothetical protein
MPVIAQQRLAALPVDTRDAGERRQPRDRAVQRGHEYADQDRDGGNVTPGDVEPLVAECFCHLHARPLRA